MKCERLKARRTLRGALTRPLPFSSAAAIVALSCVLSSHLMGQAPGRRTVPVTLVQVAFADSAPAAVILPRTDGRVTILLPMEVTPEHLLSAVAALDSKRLPLVPTGVPPKAIVINRVVTSRLSAELEARLRARLDQLKRQPARALEGFGQVRSLTIPISLASPRLNGP